MDDGDPGRARRRPRNGRADPGFFDDAYYRLLEPFHSEADARAETAALRELLALAQDDRILDLGCGWGRHLRLLAGAGHDVVGLDLSVTLLRRAQGETDDDGTGDGRGASPLVAADMLRLPFADGAFDAVLNLATSLGLFLEDGPARRALGETRRVLRAGGRLLVEGMHRADVEAHFAARDAWTLKDGTTVRVRRRFDPGRAISHEVLRWQGPRGSGRKRHSLRLRSAEELVSLLESAGFRVLERHGDWTGVPFASDAPRLIVVASRR